MLCPPNGFSYGGPQAWPAKNCTYKPLNTIRYSSLLCVESRTSLQIVPDTRLYTPRLYTSLETSGGIVTSHDILWLRIGRRELQPDH
jgi:hypothetical protein